MSSHQLSQLIKPQSSQIQSDMDIVTVYQLEHFCFIILISTRTPCFLSPWTDLLHFQPLLSLVSDYFFHLFAAFVVFSHCHPASLPLSFRRPDEVHKLWAHNVTFLLIIMAFTTILGSLIMKILSCCRSILSWCLTFAFVRATFIKAGTQSWLLLLAHAQKVSKRRYPSLLIAEIHLRGSLKIAL